MSKKNFSYIELIFLISVLFIVFSLILNGNKIFDKQQSRSLRTEQMAYFSKNILESVKNNSLENISLEDRQFKAIVVIENQTSTYDTIKITVKDKKGMAKDYVLVSYIVKK